VVPSPDSAGRNELTAVSCLSASACTAVGFHGRPVHTLIESWHGGTWSVVRSPSGAGRDELLGVSCLSASICTAVGFHQGSVRKSLIESWNGAAWSIVPSPNEVTTNNDLAGVSCAAASACTAAGGGPRTLVESWNGNIWSIVPSPSPSPAGRGGDTLAGVSCLSPTACIAVGSHGFPEKTLIESWNGSTWSVVPPERAHGRQRARRSVVHVSQRLHRGRLLPEQRQRQHAGRVVEWHGVVDHAQPEQGVVR
jgi:hypothetical protein